MKRVLLILAIPLGVVFAAGLLIAVVWGFIRARDAFSTPRGAVLVYEVDPRFTPGTPSTELIENLLATIDARLNPGWQRRARVRLRDDQRLEIRLYESRPEAVRAIEQVIEALGLLEFRVLANSHDHAELIERAKTSPAADIHGADGRLLAWWVPVRDAESAHLQEDKDIATRLVTDGDRQGIEVLVVKDSCDVTGKYLTEAAMDYRESTPSVDFTFNQQGGELFGELTSANAPDHVTGFKRRLGIILDGHLQTAPTLQSAIYGRGQITGNFTEAEVHDIVDILNAGSLPAPVRKVKERQADNASQE
jgi:SecD/SecF fusion protein